MTIGKGGMVFLIAGLVALTVAAWQAWGTWRFLQSSIAAEGTIMRPPNSTQATTAGNPFISFRTVDGAEVQYLQRGMGRSTIGSTVQLRYDVRDPAGTARVVSSWWSLWGNAVLAAVMGVAGLLFGLGGAQLGIRGRM